MNAKVKFTVNVILILILFIFIYFIHIKSYSLKFITAIDSTDPNTFAYVSFFKQNTQTKERTDTIVLDKYNSQELIDFLSNYSIRKSIRNSPPDEAILYIITVKDIEDKKITIVISDSKHIYIQTKCGPYIYTTITNGSIDLSKLNKTY